MSHRALLRRAAALVALIVPLAVTGPPASAAPIDAVAIDEVLFVDTEGSGDDATVTLEVRWTFDAAAWAAVADEPHQGFLVQRVDGGVSTTVASAGTAARVAQFDSALGATFDLEVVGLEGATSEAAVPLEASAATQPFTVPSLPGYPSELTVEPDGAAGTHEVALDFGDVGDAYGWYLRDPDGDGVWRTPGFADPRVWHIITESCTRYTLHVGLYIQVAPTSGPDVVEPLGTPREITFTTLDDHGAPCGGPIGPAVPPQPPADAPDRPVLPAPPPAAIERTTAGEVHRLYLALLGRQADEAGLAHWVARHHAGATTREVVEGIVDTHEGRRVLGGASGPALLDLLYRQVLGREPDAVGHAYWSARLADGSVSDARLIEVFVTSEELLRRVEAALAG